MQDRVPAHGSHDLERRAQERLIATLPEGALAIPNVRWIASTRDRGPARDGETDLVIVDPTHGAILTIEIKDGSVTRDGFGRWYAGQRPLDVSPFEQTELGKWALQAKIEASPKWHGAGPRMIHAVAFPETDRATLAGHGRDLGPDAPGDLILDRADLADGPSARRAMERVFRFWSGDGTRERPLTDDQVAAIQDVLEPAVTLRALLSTDLDVGERELLGPTHHQLRLLTTLRTERRASIVGGAGSGKTLLAAAKARQLAERGFNVLLVCFNQPLARALADDKAARALEAAGRLTVTTFHELCRSLGTEAGVLPPTPTEPGAEWFKVTLPAALDAAIPTVGGRWQAVVVDEGQDFEAAWLESLDLLLSDPGEDVFYLFHDPAQALYRADASATLGLRDFALPDNCRNAKPIHDFAYRWYTGDLDVEPLRDDGHAPEVVIAEPGAPTVEALRVVLNKLVHTEQVARERIAVLIGMSLEHSAVWRQRGFKGDLTLWNGNVDDAGKSLRLAAGQVPAQPARTILCDTIHRFKGLERDVVVLVELRPDDERLEKLLYIGASRAKHHLVVIVPPEVAQRFGIISS